MQNNTTQLPQFRDPQQAFAEAIASGRLSDSPAAANYAGYYMYMGPGTDGRDSFKHYNTRQYIK